VTEANNIKQICSTFFQFDRNDCYYSWQLDIEDTKGSSEVIAGFMVDWEGFGDLG
jgi:hypothetical protein